MTYTVHGYCYELELLPKTTQQCKQLKPLYHQGHRLAATFSTICPQQGFLLSLALSGKQAKTHSPKCFHHWEWKTVYTPWPKCGFVFLNTIVGLQAWQYDLLILPNSDSRTIMLAVNDQKLPGVLGVSGRPSLVYKEKRPSLLGLPMYIMYITQENVCLSAYRLL